MATESPPLSTAELYTCQVTRSRYPQLDNYCLAFFSGLKHTEKCIISDEIEAKQKRINTLAIKHNGQHRQNVLFETENNSTNQKPYCNIFQPIT